MSKEDMRTGKEDQQIMFFAKTLINSIVFQFYLYLHVICNDNISDKIQKYELIYSAQ